MANRRQLTGGTGDVNPQFIGMSVTETAANAFTQVEAAIPVLRQGMGNKAKYQVIEALWIEWQATIGDNADLSGRIMQLTTRSFAAATSLDNSDLIAISEVRDQFTTSGRGHKQLIERYKLHDGAGHGVIIATPSIFFAVVGISQTAALTARARLYYRFKNIGLQEFIGLSLQQA